MSPAPQRRSSAERTRRKLVEVGRTAFAALGHDGVRLQRDVLTPAGVSVGSFYHQFRDKTDLLVAVLDDATRAGQAMVAEAPSAVSPSDVVAATCASYHRWFGLVDVAEDVVRIQMRERDNPDARIRTLLAQLSSSWIESLAASFERFAVDNPAFDPRRAARVVHALGLGVLLVYLDTPLAERPTVRDDLLDALVPFTLGGFAALGAGARPA